jgi:transcriptional regulator with XRE-family HTH domain
MKFLGEIRQKRGLTQAALAEMVGIGVNSIARYERGEITPSITIAHAIADALHVTEAELLNGPVATEWRVEAIFKREEEWEMNGNVDMSKGAPSMFLAQVGMEKIALNLVGSPKDEEELDGLWSRLKPQIMKIVSLRDNLNDGFTLATA